MDASNLNNEEKDQEVRWTLACHCRIKMSFRRPCRIWLGKVIRDILSIELRRRCPYTSCRKCSPERKEKCPYHYLFASDPPPLLFAIPPPWDILRGLIHESTNPWKNNGRILSLEFTLFGKEMFPTIISALVAAGKNKLRYGIGFDIREIVDHTNNLVFDGSDYNTPSTFNPWEVRPIRHRNIYYIQYTPHELPLPVSLKTLISKIRDRLIRYANAFSNGFVVPCPQISAKLDDYTVAKIHLRLQRRKEFFNASVGVLSYTIEKISFPTSKMLALAPYIGGGKNISFGFGFAKIEENPY
ncbi:MAG: hypothetical protein QXL15_02350 [Candidatus Korarchaeota archaeon]